MPRQSKHAKHIKRLHEFLHKRLRYQVIREVSGDDDEDEDILDGYIALHLEEAESQQYHKPRGPYRKAKKEQFEAHLDEDIIDDELPWLSEDKFLQKAILFPS